MPRALAIVVFFAMEVIAYVTVHNLETGFVWGIVAALITYMVARSWEERLNKDRDNPAHQSFRIAPPRAFAVIKKVVRTFHWGERSWRISDDDKSNMTIQAVSQWRDRSYKDQPELAPEGSLVRKVVLDAAVRRNSGNGLTDVRLVWTVLSEVEREEANELQDRTTEAIMTALAAAQSSRPTATGDPDEDSDDGLAGEHPESKDPA